MRRVILWAFVILATLLPALTLAAGRFPTPEFSFDYQFHRIATPMPRPPAFEWIDVVVLVLTLGLAAWLAIVRRSRLEVFVLTVFAVAYFGFYRVGCVCTVGAVQNVALALGTDYVLPVSVGLFFLLPLLFALLFGRVFCAAVCPLGALQETLVIKPVKVPIWLERSLGLIPFVFLGLAVLFAWNDSGFLICRYDPYIAFFRLGGFTHVLIAGGVVLLIGAFVGRPYCRFLCPLAAIFRLLAPLSAWRVRLAGDDCINCHLCADACPYNAIRPPTVEERSKPPSTGRWTLAAIVIAFPVAIGLGAFLGYLGSDYLAGTNQTVQTAARVFAEQQGIVEGTTEQSEAFYERGEPVGELYREAAGITRRFEIGSTVLGGFIGLIVVGQLIAVSLRRSREHYEIDPAACVSCARCFSSCPLENKRGRSKRSVDNTRDEK